MQVKARIRWVPQKALEPLDLTAGRAHWEQIALEWAAVLLPWEQPEAQAFPAQRAFPAQQAQLEPLRLAAAKQQVVGGQRGLLPVLRSRGLIEPACEFQQGVVASLLTALGCLEPQHALEDWEQIQPVLDRS
jgi:hypothetical protein